LAKYCLFAEVIQRLAEFLSCFQNIIWVFILGTPVAVKGDTHDNEKNREGEGEEIKRPEGSVF